MTGVESWCSYLSSEPEFTIGFTQRVLALRFPPIMLESVPFSSVVEGMMDYVKRLSVKRHKIEVRSNSLYEMFSRELQNPSIYLLVSLGSSETCHSELTGEYEGSGVGGEATKYKDAGKEISISVSQSASISVVTQQPEKHTPWVLYYSCMRGRGSQNGLS
jgi:hypothetical protein